MLNDTFKLGRLNREGFYRHREQEVEGFADAYYLLFPIYVSLLVFTFLHVQISLMLTQACLGDCWYILGFNVNVRCIFGGRTAQ